MNVESLPEVIGGVAGFILSVVAEYVPAYQSLADKYKRLVMLAALVLAAGLTYGLSCLGWLAVIFPSLALTCDAPGLVVLVRAFLAALASNQGTFGLFFRGRPIPAPDLFMK